MSKIAVIGAGKTGRGFIGRLLAEGGQSVLFVDKNGELVRQLNEKQQFAVHFFGNVRTPFTVENYRAVTWEQADLSDAELILVSVGGQNLAEVGAELKKRLTPNQNVTIITAENASHPSKTLAQALGIPGICISEATVFCTTIEKEGLDISSENYPYLQCNAELLGGYTPPLPQIRPIENFSDFLTRKLYTYNAASCVIAYMGWYYGYSVYGDAANDPRILEMLDDNYAQTNRVLCQEFGYEAQDQMEFAALSKAKFCDRTIVDTVARNARDPQRKLAYGERIVGPMELIFRNGGDSTVLEKTCAAAVLYDQDPNWQELKAGKSYSQILTEFCGLQPGTPLHDRVMDWINVLK